MSGKEIVREKGTNTRRSKEERRGGMATSLLLVTPSQLPGFMESFLSWCCFLIDIKMHWPVCQRSPSPSLKTLTPPFTLYLLNSPCLTDGGCHLHTGWRDRNGSLTSHLTSASWRPAAPSHQNGFACKTMFCILPIYTNTSFRVSMSYFMVLSCARRGKKKEKSPLAKKKSTALPQECDVGSRGCSRAFRCYEGKEMETNASEVKGKRVYEAETVHY